MENRSPVVLDLRCLAMHQPFGSDDIATEGHGQRLMAEADAQEWKTPGEMPYGLDGHTRFDRGAGPWGNDDTAGLQRLDLVDRNLVVAEYPNVFTQFPKILYEVISKGIVVIDHQ